MRIPTYIQAHIQTHIQTDAKQYRSDRLDRSVITRLAIALMMPFFILLLNGCVPLMIGAGAGYVGAKATQERTIGNAIDDVTIKAKINSKFIQEDFDNLFSEVSVQSYEGRVLLTGTVPDSETKIKAVQKTWEVEGVKEVINEIELGDKSGVKDYMKDAWLSTQVRSKLLLNKDVKSRNYNVETVNAVVYLIGIAQSESEIRLASYLAGTVSGVQKVVNHARIKDSYLRKKGLGLN